MLKKKEKIKNSKQNILKDAYRDLSFLYTGDDPNDLVNNK